MNSGGASAWGSSEIHDYDSHPQLGISKIEADEHESPKSKLMNIEVFADECCVTCSCDDVKMQPCLQRASVSA